MHLAPSIMAVAVAASLVPAAPAAGNHPFGLDDWMALRAAHPVAVAPDGRTVLYEVSWNGDKGPAKQEWHTIGRGGDNDRKLDLPEEFEPQGFTRDGASLYGTYPVDKTPQLGIVSLAAGGVTRTMGLPRGVHAAILSPDGSRYAILADPRPKDPQDAVHTVVENGVSSLYVTGTGGAAGSWWCPQLQDISEIAWSADGARIAVLSSSQKIGHHDPQSFIDVCASSGVSHVYSVPNAVSGIAWAGPEALAFASTTTPVLTPEHLFTVTLDGEAADRTPQLQGSATSVVNDPRGTVWVEVHRGVTTEIDTFSGGALHTAYRWPSGTIESLPVTAVIAAAPGTLAVAVGDPGHSSNVAVADGRELRKITHEGDDRLAAVSLGDVRSVQWVAKSGTHLEGIVTFPAGYTPGKKYPFLVLPHGGPEANDVLGFDFPSRLISGLGYVVLQPEYRGSTGYGSAFLAAIYQHFGDRAYSDVDSATDFAISQGWADPDHLAIFGWSAGGFMTAWTVTQTHRYRAAIEGAGITDWLSFIPTSDIGQTDYDARWPEHAPDPFLKFSAVNFADRVTTPLLILHGESDVRVPTFQGREYFVLLAEQNKQVRMVTYPGSPHFPRLAEQRRDVFKEIGEWLSKYNGPRAQPDATDP